MKLSDIEKTNSSVMNNKMREKLGWNLNLAEMTVDSANAMMESINTKLATVRKSHKLHESQNNPNYVGMLMAKQILESFVIEAKKKNVKESELKVKEGNKFSGELKKAKEAGLARTQETTLQAKKNLKLTARNIK